MPVAVAAWFGGRGPGVLAAVLITVLGASFVGPDLLRDTSDLVALIAVAVQAAAVVAITVALRTALVRARESAHAAEEARRELKFAVAVRDEVLRVWSEKVRGPLARLEVVASDALEGLERDGYRGAATRSLRALVDDAGMLRRVTANWNPTSFPAKTDEI
jgi:hypothetical protein